MTEEKNQDQEIDESENLDQVEIEAGAEELVEEAAEEANQDEVETKPVEETETEDEDPPVAHNVVDTDDDDVGPILATVHGSLTRAIIEEIRKIPCVWEKMTEAQCNQVIESAQNRAEKQIRRIANAMNTRGFQTCEAIVDTVNAKDEWKAVLKTHDDDGGVLLALRAGGKKVIVVFADEEDYLQGGRMPEGHKDQPSFLSDNGGADFGLTGGGHVDDSQSQVDDSKEDPLFWPVAVWVVEQGKCSISGVQREMRVSYNRAARLIETMESHGIISPKDETGTREVLVDSDYVEKAQKEAEEVEEVEVLPILHRPGNFELRVTGSIESNVQANDIEDAIHKLGYTEFEIMEQGTAQEMARIFDDERIEDDDAIVEVYFSENQTAA